MTAVTRRKSSKAIFESNFAAKSASGADPDGDGQANVVEYVLGSVPGVFASTGWLDPSTVSTGGRTYFTLSYLLRPDVTVQTEASDDLKTWGKTTLVEVGRTPQPDGSERITLREALPLEGGGSRRFLRIRVAKP